MADYSLIMSEAVTFALKDTLCAQQQLLQKLYNELDAEREASATSASEALSVILRLQCEKAALRMEAGQYKRLSEEKISHAEESLEIIQDIIFQKDMEVSALEYQVQAYRCKLLSMGCDDPGGIGDVNFPDNYLERNDNFLERNETLKFNKVANKKDCSVSPEMSLVPKVVEEQTSQEMCDEVFDSTDNSVSRSIGSYLEQIKLLDTRVKEIAGGNKTPSPSTVSSQISAGNLCGPSNPANPWNKKWSPSPLPYDSNEVDFLNKIDGTKQLPANLSENDVAVDDPCSPSFVHDVFEVPQAEGREHRAHQVSEIVEKAKAVKLDSEDEADCVNLKLLQSTHQEYNLCNNYNIGAIDCHLAFVQQGASVSESQPELDHGLINRTSEITESERPAEMNCKREEELMLLNEIKDKLNSLNDEIRSWRVKKSRTKDEPSLCPLAEAMLYFWL